MGPFRQAASLLPDLHTRPLRTRWACGEPQPGDPSPNNRLLPSPKIVYGLSCNKDMDGPWCFPRVVAGPTTETQPWRDHAMLALVEPDTPLFTDIREFRTVGSTGSPPLERRAEKARAEARQAGDAIGLVADADSGSLVVLRAA